MSSKHSPKKISRSVTPESLDLANKVFEGKRDLFTLDQSEMQTCLQGLQALRHRSMIDNNKRKMQKCDSLILELNNIIKASTKDSNSIKSSGSNSINFSSSGSINLHNSSGFSSPLHNQVEITEDEMNQINSIINSLLNGSEIDTIDSYSIPKLEAVLKMRKAKAIEESDYQTAKILEKNIQSLSKHRQKTKVSSPMKQKEFIADLEGKIKILTDELKQLNENFIEEKERIKIDREESLNSLFAQNEKEVNELLEIKTDIMMGVGFKPSKKLIELRQQEASLAKLSLFDEASATKKKAEDLEIIERREFDRKSSRNFDIKEKEQRKKQNAKIKTTQEYWDNLLERTENRFEIKIKSKQSEIDKIKAKIEEISGKEYNTNNNDTISNFSGLSFNDDNNLSISNKNDNNESNNDPNINDNFNYENENLIDQNNNDDDNDTTTTNNNIDDNSD